MFTDDTDTFLEADQAVLKDFSKGVWPYGEVSGCNCHIEQTVCVLLSAAEQAQHHT